MRSVVGSFVTTVDVKIKSLREVTPCGFVDRYQHFGGIPAICRGFAGEFSQLLSFGFQELYSGNYITCLYQGDN